MGIQGLMSYITNRPEFLQDYVLHDTNLVIDGRNLASQLYQNNHCDYCFGGDYEKYAYHVNQFFDELLKCKITPLIIYDGGIEDKKMDSVVRRAKERIADVSHTTPTHQKRVLPILATHTFKYIVRQKKIKSAQTIFEADEHIASVAKILNCPVLSFDSDFFIYDVLYIPLNTLKNGVSQNSNGLGFVKKSKIFKTEYFLKSFNGMDKNVLPMAAVILGNDYLKSTLFNDFLSTLNVSEEFKKQYPFERQQRIEALFRWMQNHSLNSAISTVINTINPKKRQSIIEVIEIIINDYLNPSTELLGPLGYSQQEIEALMQNISIESYKFQYTGDFRDESKKITDSHVRNLSCTEDNGKMVSTIDSFIFKPRNDIDINGTLPAWFLEKYLNANFSNFFIDMINRRLIVVSEQMADLSQPACIHISLKITSVIFKLLHNGLTDFKSMKYIARGDKINVKTFELDCDQYKFNFEIPTLQELKDHPISKKKEILTITLGVDDKVIAEFPPTWRLYIAAIKYWLNEADAAFTTMVHLYTLMLLLIYHVIKKLIKDQSHFVACSNVISSNQESINREPNRDIPIKTALENITTQDCFLALRYFESHASIKRNEKFEIAIIHAFSLLQNCLIESISLNELLDNPYPKANVSEFFNGKLTYNIYNDIKKMKSCFYQNICKIFKNSPSVLQLFVSLSAKMENIRKKKVCED